MTGADWLLAALAAEGVEVLFGNPGSTELPLTDALARGRGPRYVLGLHEAAVMGMADGYAQSSGRLVAVNVHVQPGMANALSGLLNAARCRVPLLVTVGQQVQAMLPAGPFLGGDVLTMARPFAKGAWEARDAASLAALTARAVRVATTPPCGPVVLSVPVDVQAGPAPPAHVPAGRVAAPAPPPDAVAAAAALLAAARRPVVIAGDGVAHAACGTQVAALAEALGAPLHSEPMAARAPLPTDHPLWRGPLPPFAAAIRAALDGADVVLALGMPVFRLFGPSPGPALPAGAVLVHADVDAAEIGRSHPARVGLAGDLAATVTALRAAVAPVPQAAARAARETAVTAEARRRARAALHGGPRTAITPASLCRALAGAVGPRDLVVDEALTSGRQLRAALGRRLPATWLAHRGSALGWGLPAAVGAKIADPSRRVLCVHGDGSWLFGMHALWTAAHEGAGVAVVIADNGGYEILRAGLEGLTGRAEDRWPGLALASPAVDHLALARGFGATADRVDHPADLPAALRDLWRRAADGPAVLVAAVTGRTPPVGHPPGEWA